MADEVITVCAYLWYDPDGKRNSTYIYGEEHARVLKSMIARNLTLPHRFVCISDRAIDGVETVKIDMRTHVPRSRYAKLMTFRPDISEILGPRILQLDLDTVVVRNIDALVDRPEDLVLWRNPCFGLNRRRTRYNTSILLYRAGTRNDIWEKFDVRRTPVEMGQHTSGTDQAWVSHMAGENAPYWSHRHGIYNAGTLQENSPTPKVALPADARIVMFPGKRDPGMSSVQKRFPWIEEHRK
jgi:hypothetical protein